GLGLGGSSAGGVGPGNGGSAPGVGGGAGIGAPGQSAVAAFNAMSPSERRTVLKRCRDVVNGGYDRGLVALCRLLQSTASR
ncbi:hypothetical protein BMJ20_18170, partial [Sinorhizobium medicae]